MESLQISRSVDRNELRSSTGKLFLEADTVEVQYCIEKALPMTGEGLRSFYASHSCSDILNTEVNGHRTPGIVFDRTAVTHVTRHSDRHLQTLA